MKLVALTKIKQTVFTVANDIHTEVWRLSLAKDSKPYVEVDKALREYIAREFKILKAKKGIKKK